MGAANVGAGAILDAEHRGARGVRASEADAVQALGVLADHGTVNHTGGDQDVMLTGETIAKAVPRLCTTPTGVEPTEGTTVRGFASRVSIEVAPSGLAVLAGASWRKEARVMSEMCF